MLASAEHLVVTLNASEEVGNDFDLYVKFGSAPTTSVFDCKADGNNQSTGTIFYPESEPTPTPALGPWALGLLSLCLIGLAGRDTLSAHSGNPFVGALA